MTDGATTTVPSSATSSQATVTPPAPAPAGRGRSNATAERARAETEAEKAHREATAAAKAKETADAAARKAKAEADAAKAHEEDVKRYEAARKHLRKASPDDPIPLRRVETQGVVGDTLYGNPRNVIDLRNRQEFADVTLLYDGQVVHVIHGRDPGKSFWIGFANIAAMYPRFDI